MWLLFAVASAVFAGATAILAKVGIRNVNSHLATALRTVVVLVFAWVMVLVVGSGGTLWQITPRTLLFLGLSGLATGASWICYFRALQLGDVNKVAPIDKSSTILTMLLAFLFLGEPLTWLMALGMVLMGVGTWLMIAKQQTGAGTAKAEAPKNKSWAVYAVLSAVFASLVAILGKVGIADVESNLGTALRTVVVLVFAWGIVLAQGLQKQMPQIDRKSWLFIGLSGVTTGLSWLCYYRALQIGNASLVAPIDKLSIVVTIAFSVFFLKEKLSRRALVGLALVVAGTLVLLIK